MKRFAKGDLAITCNSLAPLLNNGHLVAILEVWGPGARSGIAFAYLVERVDGQPFAIGFKPGTPIPVAGCRQVIGDQHQLRPLLERLEDISVVEADEVPA